MISTEFIGETFKSVRRSEGAKGLRNLLKSENSGVSQNDTCTNDESGQPKTQKIVTNVTRKTTTTKRVLRRVVIDANGKEHVTEEILGDPVDLGEPPQNTKLENKPSMVVEDTSQKVTKTKEETKHTTESTSQKDWVNIPIVEIAQIASTFFIWFSDA